VRRHLEGTSGILGIIKAILMIQQGRILPTAHFEKFNKNIEGREKLKVRVRNSTSRIGGER
jgi:acyl transferase domain-containing protein